MPIYRRGETSIHYEEHGSGYPVLLLAPGGMRSNVAFWERSPFHPIRELAGSFRVVAMDQRNAGQSRAPVHASDDWRTYTSDHVALLDHLGIERCHALGGCIGGAFALSLLTVAPSRVTAAVLLQPIGLGHDNRGVFHDLFDSWASELGPTRPDLMPEALAGMKRNLFDGDFVFAVSRDDVRRASVPILVLRGNDVYHPSETSEEIARIAPRGELIASWKEGDDVARAVARVKEFLTENVPRSTSGGPAR
jgi:pimeloyl-ACP methyl ester carboxylesterase